MGSGKVANIVVLGALLEATGILTTARAAEALSKLVNPKWLKLDIEAMEKGQEELRRIGLPISEDYLWGV